MDWIDAFWVLAILLFLAYQVFNKLATAKTMDELLLNYYKERGLSITHISKLRVPERIKYGVPISPFIRFYTSTFSMLTFSNESYFRNIETVDISGKEHIRYVEVDLTNSSLHVKEFDVYEF